MYYVHRNILYVTLCRQNISQYFNHIKRRMLRTETTEVHQCHSSVSWQNYVMLIIPSGASLVAQRVKPACNAGDLGSIPGSERSPGERKWQPTPVLLPGNSHGQRSLLDYSPWDHKESDTTERLHPITL